MSKTILVVEDDNDSRMAICAIVEAHGYQTIGFGSGKEALKGIVGKQLLLALVDVMMPEMNGFEFITALKKMPEFVRVPIVMVTARDADDQVLEGYQHGADYYITKPFTSEQLRYGIQMCLGEGDNK